MLVFNRRLNGTRRNRSQPRGIGRRMLKKTPDINTIDPFHYSARLFTASPPAVPNAQRNPDSLDQRATKSATASTVWTRLPPTIPRTMTGPLRWQKVYMTGQVTSHATQSHQVFRHGTKTKVREFRHSSEVASVVKTQSYNTLMALTAPIPRIPAQSPYRK